MNPIRKWLKEKRMRKVRRDLTMKVFTNTSNWHIITHPPTQTIKEWAEWVESGRIPEPKEKQ